MSLRPQGSLEALEPLLDSDDREIAEAAGERRIRFPVADLETGGKKNFIVELMPLAGGHIDLDTRVSFATKSEIRTQVLQPELELAYQGPREAETGKKVAFRLIITNPQQRAKVLWQSGRTAAVLRVQ